MSSNRRVAVVTGSNKGIGFAIVRALCKQFDGDVFVTSRNEGRGQIAVEELRKEGLNPKFHQLDIDDKSSIARLRSFLESSYGGLDVLVNNAAIAYKGDSKAPFEEQAELTCRTNFWSTLEVCRQLFPLLRPHARVVHLSSFVSQMTINKCSNAVKVGFKDAKTMETLAERMQDFMDAAKAQQVEKRGYPKSAYGMSKVAVTVMTFIQDREMRNDPREDIIINAADPGWVNTDMSSHTGPKSIDQGADTPVYLALLPPNCAAPRGEFVADRKAKKWG